MTQNPDDTFRRARASYEAEDWVTAMAMLPPLADAGHSGAQYLLAEMYRWGQGWKQDWPKARHYYEVAADQGNAWAAFNLGLILLGGNSYPGPISFPANAARSEHYIAVAVNSALQEAAKGNTDAMLLLGSIRHFGFAPQLISDEEAIEWLTKAFSAGNTIAANGLCLVYHESLNSKIRDKAKARYWYSQAELLGIRHIGIKELESSEA